MKEEILIKIVAQVIRKYVIDAIYVPAGVSNRHIHIKQEDLEILFGKDYELNKLKDLKQPGEFASNETVTLVTKKATIPKVRILGPIRKDTQVELSLSDGFLLGVNNIPIRESGNIKDSEGIIVRGPAGEIEIEQGAIAAHRHIHMPKDFADLYGFKDKEIVSVTTEGIRSVTFNNVMLRVSEKYALEIHLDLDEANAARVKNGDLLKIVRHEGGAYGY
ncbi:MAG: propanediol utilization protein [Firmicutes bacterium HGW-Firmicutes-7]|nr:MAG: propanediol utilization protein [Firmicutes bacterium HGW-Firmicutes-7]